ATTDPVWQGMTFQFTATGPSTTLAFRSLEPGTNFGPLIDNVNVVESVPEPSTVALVAIGLLAVGSQHRRVERKFRSTR
ncbi:MAG TPA: PEP-CTERM sorting domain-containing protein, partial [Armatimonadetes bacterium]|nr:PEP-CTERM sorting domain-containing protein [Armatimonadota bacterium]